MFLDPKSRRRSPSHGREKAKGSGSTVCTNGMGSSIDSQMNGDAAIGGGRVNPNIKAGGGGGGGGRSSSRGRSVRKEDVRHSMDRAKSDREMREAEMEDRRDTGGGRCVRRSDVPNVSSSSSTVGGRWDEMTGGGRSRSAGRGGENRSLLERGQRRRNDGTSSSASASPARSASSRSRRRSAADVTAASRAAASTIASMDGSRRGRGRREDGNDDDRRRRCGSRPRFTSTYFPEDWALGEEKGEDGVYARRGGDSIERVIQERVFDGGDDAIMRRNNTPCHPPSLISSSSSKIRHPIDRVQASLDVHHHRRGGRYRNQGGNRRGSAASTGNGGSSISIREGGDSREKDDDDNDDSGMGCGLSSRSTTRPRSGRGSTSGPSPSPSRSSFRGDRDRRRKSGEDVERHEKSYSCSPSRDGSRGRQRQQQQQRRAGTPGPKIGGAAEGVNRHQRMHSRSPTGSRQDRTRGDNSGDSLRGRSPMLSDCSERPPSDYRSFSRGHPAASVHSAHSRRSDKSVVSYRSHKSHRSHKSQHALSAKVLPIEISITPNKECRSAKVYRPAASVHSAHSKRDADQSVVSYRSHRSHKSQKSQDVLPSKVLPNEITVTPNETHRSVNIQTDATNSSRRSSSTGRRREDAGAHQAVNMNRVESAVRMLNVMSLVDSTLKKVATVSPASSRRPSLANNKTPMKPSNNISRPRCGSSITLRGDGNVEDHTDVLSQYSKASSSSAKSISPDGDNTAASRSFHSSKDVQLDANGCCIYHSFVQLRRPIGGGGWRIMSRTCALCVEEEAERQEIAAALASAAFKDVVDKTSNLKAGESLNRPRAIASPQSLSSTTSEGGGNDISNRPHPSERQHATLTTLPGSLGTSEVFLDSSGRGEDEESITPSCFESLSSSSDSESSIASAQSTSEDSKVLPDIREFKFNYALVSSALKPSSPLPPPPRTVNNAYNNTSDAIEKNVQNNISMVVLNPHPEPELQDEFPLLENTTQDQSFTQEVMSMLRSLEQPESMMGVQHQPDCQNQETPVVDTTKEWMKYSVKASRREITEDGSGNGKTRKLFGRESRKKSVKNEQIKSCNVKQMPFTDQFGDFGYYTGQVDYEGRPDGKGSMKYENGVFYEGTWKNGCQDKDAASQYERIRGGFTSWSGKGKGGTKSGTILPWNSRKNDAFDGREKTNVRGLDWTDLNGDSGRYTGEVDNDQLPHGPGIMRYDYGLIAEGEWVHGVLKEGPHDRMISAVAMNGGQSVAPGMLINSGMSVGPGAIRFAGGAISVLGAGGMSVCPPVGFGRGMAPPVANPQFRGMNASQHALLAHQNAMMKMHGGADGGVYGGGGGSVYHGGNGSVYGGSGSVYHGGNGSVNIGNGMVMPMQQMPAMPIQPLQHVAMQQQQYHNHQPPISNIIIK